MDSREIEKAIIFGALGFVGSLIAKTIYERMTQGGSENGLL